jgi:acetoin utilization protein AcuB
VLRYDHPIRVHFKTWCDRSSVSGKQRVFGSGSSVSALRLSASDTQVGVSECPISGKMILQAVDRRSGEREVSKVLLVRDWMTGKLVTLSPEASVAEALILCRERRIRHIPILEEGHLVGIVTDRDLRDASPALGDPERASALQKIRVRDVMTREVITADPEDSIENVAQEMYEHKIQSLPVVTEGPVVDEGSAVAEDELLGIVTSSDVMRALVMLVGLPEPGCRIEVQAANKAGVLSEVAGKIQDLEVDIVSVLSDPDRRSGNRTLIFQLVTADPSSVIESLKTGGYKVSWMA